MFELTDRLAKLLAAADVAAAHALIAAETTPAAAEIGRAVLAVFGRDAAATLAHAKRALELGAGAIAHHYLAIGHLMIGDGETAVEHARKATALDTSPRSRSALGSVLLTVGQPDEAAAVLRQVVAENPTDTDALVNLATASFKIGDYGEAMTSYARAFDQNPSDQRPIQNLMSMFAEMGRWLGAVAALDLSRKGQPPPEVAVALDLVQVQLVRLIATKFPRPEVDSDADQTVANLVANALRRAPATQLVVARTLVDLERTEDARTLVAEIDRRKPSESVDQANLLYLQGVLAERDRDQARAITLYTQALAADGRRVDACVNAISLLLENGSPAALDTIASLLERVPIAERASTPALLFNESIYLLRRDRPDAARLLLERLLDVTGGEGPMAVMASRALDELVKPDRTNP